MKRSEYQTEIYLALLRCFNRFKSLCFERILETIESNDFNHYIASKVRDVKRTLEFVNALHTEFIFCVIIRADSSYYFYHIFLC